MKKVILIADDSPTIRKFVSVSLKVKGFTSNSGCRWNAGA